ncbi:MAG: NAD(P)-binding domain-containing protein [Bryobacterales bacterium]|nr:NAD(P)-binding domain-containing protein [Bryobacterales bacterium]
MRTQQIVVIGAGPYGLSIAAHLRHAGVEPYVIGRPMGFWKHNMPGKMLLRSRHEASNIAAPRKHLSLEAYQKSIRRRFDEPLPIEDFIGYGEWFHKQVVPRLDARDVRNVANNGSGFEITFEDGEKLHAESVVLALGIGLFAQRPEQFAGIPPALASHSSEFSNLTQYGGKRVVVVGRGQSALEYAAILHENNADVQILTRSAMVDFLPFAWRKHLFRRLTPGPLRPLSWRILPPTDLGDIRTARKMADPVKFRRQSPEVQQALLKDVTTPRGAYWLPSRLQGVPVKTGVSVTNVERTGDALKLTLSDGATDQAHLVVLATGYKIDISKYHILDDSLKQAIRKTPDGYPALATNLQTSVKGLYMAGVVAEKILGPTLRFVTGTSNAGPCLAAALTGKVVH